jgi:hypothetical protein
MLAMKEASMATRTTGRDLIINGISFLDTGFCQYDLGALARSKMPPDF